MDHVEALLAALASECAFVRAEHRRLMSLAIEDRIAAGASWPLLQVEVCDLLPWGGTRLELRPPRGVLLHDGITVGEPVTVRSGGQSYEGSVRGTDSRYAEVRLRDDVALDGLVEVTARFDPTSYRRASDALRAGSALDSPLARTLLGEVSVTSEPVPRTSLPGSLNEAQTRAVGSALDAPVLALIHGPPGTGKTETLTALCAALVAEGESPLALADSNAAVDHLALRLSARGMRVLRLGLAARIRSEAEGLGLAQTVSRGPYGAALTAMERELGQLRRDGEYRAWRSLRRELRELRDTATAHAVASAQVICCTLGSLARFAETIGPRKTAVIDEATQAIEPSVWTAVPLVERLVLVGDPEQLGPVVTEPGNALGLSLFERLLAEGHEAVRLEVQHRMHADIQALVASVYGCTYRPHPAVAGHRLCDLPGVHKTLLTEVPVRFIDTTGAGMEDARDPVTCSTYNAGEVRIVERVVAMLLEAGVPASDIGVIAPYTAQVQRLAHLEVEVATVNAFQGREKEVIVCSFVRSNLDGELGFVADRRRLTVALTRARRSIVGIGDLATLANDAMFAALGEQLADMGTLDSVWSAPWDDLVAE